MKNLGTKQLETNRLILRKIKSNDYIDAFKNWCNSDLVDKYVTGQIMKILMLLKHCMMNG